MGSSPVSLRVFGVSLVILAMTVPWLDGGTGPLGLPMWAVASLVATLAYALFLAFALGRVFAEDADGPNGSGGSADP